MNWEKLGKFLAGVITSVVALVGVYSVITSRPATIAAEVTYDYQTYPDQLITRLTSSNTKFGYKDIYENIRSLGNGNIGHDEIDAITKHVSNAHFEAFRGLFEDGIKQYNTRLFIYISNPSSRVARNVVVNLPESALVSYQDELGAYGAPMELTRSVKFESIAPSNNAKIWAYMPYDLDTAKRRGVRISHEDGVADVSIYEEFKGFDAAVARRSGFLVSVFAVLVLLVTGWIFLAVFSNEQNDEPTT